MRLCLRMKALRGAERQRRERARRAGAESRAGSGELDRNSESSVSAGSEVVTHVLEYKASWSPMSRGFFEDENF